MATPLLISVEILHAKQLWNPTRGIFTVLDLSKTNKHSYYKIDFIQGIFNIQIIIRASLQELKDSELCQNIFVNNITFC